MATVSLAPTAAPTALASLPWIDAATLVRPSARAVIVAPHPDDEVLGAGGLMRLLTRLGRKQLLLAVTDGAASHPGSAVWSPQRLAATRPEETRCALSMLGAEPKIMRAHLPDGDVTAHRGTLAAILSSTLQARDVVITTWRLDGHPDHEAVGQVCAEIVPVMGARLVEMPIWGCAWEDASIDPHIWARACRLALDDTTLRLKRCAVGAFSSQLEIDSSTKQLPILTATALGRWLRPFEVFFL